MLNFLSFGERQTENHNKIPFPTKILAKIKNFDGSKYWWGYVTTETVKMYAGKESITALDTLCYDPLKWNLCTFCFQANSLLGMKSSKALPYVNKKSCLKMQL